MITKKYLTFYQFIFESLIELLRLLKMDPVERREPGEYFVNEILRPIFMPAYGLGMMFGFYLIYYDQNWIVETLLDFLSALGLGFIFGTALFIFGIHLFVYFLRWRSLEDSDDGDDEGREVDYMSDESSDSEEELEKDHDIKGVDQDEGISKMLDSDESSDDEKKKSGDDDDDDEDETGKKKKKKEESDEETEDKKGKKKKSGSAASSRSATPTKEMEKQERDQKRKAMVANLLDPNAVGGSQAKKSRLEQFGSSGATSSSAFGDITEEAVRRYLKRRPMTTTDLLKKFKSKKSGANSQELVKHLADLLKKINPQKQKTQGTVYLSLKE